MKLETLKAYIEINLANGFIRPLKSFAGVSIVFGRKSDGSLRLYVKYQGLNNLTIKNRYPLLLIGESLNRLERVKRIISLYLTSAYHQMRIGEEDEWKTAFRTRYSHFKYQVMLFGLINALASFQGYINKIFAEKLDIFDIVYLDDILIYTNDDGDGHVAAIRWVLEQLRKFLLFANLNNCRFVRKKFSFSAIWCPLKASAWRTKELRLSNNGLSLSLYKTSKYSSDSRTFIDNLFRDSIE